jgi:hypothetical protein
VKLYKVSYRTKDGEHAGFSYHTSMEEAGKAARGGRAADHSTEINSIDVVQTKVGIVAALNFHASHPDNG